MGVAVSSKVVWFFGLCGVGAWTVVGGSDNGRLGHVVSLLFRSDRVGFTVQLMHQTDVGMVYNANAHVLILLVISSSAGDFTRVVMACL